MKIEKISNGTKYLVSENAQQFFIDNNILATKWVNFATKAYNITQYKWTSICYEGNSLFYIIH